MSPTHEDLPPVPDGSGPISVESWRWKTLLEIGCKDATAEKLAKAGHADLHKMCEAKKAGCTDARLLKIFL